jgi:ribose transport system ATP-binding protein
MDIILELKEVTKVYPGVVALDKVSMSFIKGEVHALMGENGAGKSTLIKVIAGAINQEEGSIVIDKETFTRMTPALARSKGIGVIYQEFNIVPSMSVADNIFLGEKVGGRFVQDKKAIHRRASEIFRRLGVNVNTHNMVGMLSTAKQQLVEIAKAMAKDVKILIMDEPSAALSVSEVQRLFEIIRLLKEKGVTILYISHRMEEVFQIADRVTVMRDGRYIDTRDMAHTTRKELVDMMVGRELTEAYPRRSLSPGSVVLETRCLSGNGVHDINISLRKGEILGLAGLVGAGRTELARLLFGDAKADTGEIHVYDRPVRFSTPQDAIRLGIGLIPEDRKRDGVFLGFPVDWNIAIMSMPQLSRWTIMDKKKICLTSLKYRDLFHIKTPSMSQLVKNLSGGNQQKVVMAKVLATKADILIFDEPTRGIDIGAKQEIYKLMSNLVSEGMSIIMISSEMVELIGMCDRIVVLHGGRQAGELLRDEFNQQRILELASGI